MIACLAAAFITVSLPAAPAAAAAVEDHFHIATSTSTAWPERSVTVNCPPGQIVWGFGGLTIGGAGHIALTAIYPNVTLTSVTATARVRGDWQGPWEVQARATCWPQGNVGLELVHADGGAVADVSCPGQKKVYASGFQVTAKLGSAYAAAVVPESDMSGVTVRAGGAEPVGLGARAFALCGRVNLPEIYIYRRTETIVPVDPATTTTAAAPPMQHSPSGWSWTLGAGVSSTAPNMFIDGLGPVPSLDAGMGRMSRDASIQGSSMMMISDEGGDEMSTWGTCIGSWY